jgi:hypothetical protein
MKIGSAMMRVALAAAMLLTSEAAWATEVWTSSARIVQQVSGGQQLVASMPVPDQTYHVTALITARRLFTVTDSPWFDVYCSVSFGGGVADAYRRLTPVESVALFSVDAVGEAYGKIDVSCEASPDDVEIVVYHLTATKIDTVHKVDATLPQGPLGPPTPIGPAVPSKPTLLQ